MQYRDGSVPGTNTSRNGKRQMGVASRPVFLSISTKTKFGGTSKSGGTKSTTPSALALALASSMTRAKKSIQMGSAADAPVCRSPRGIGLSWPTQTPAHRSGEKPMNQASEYLSVVPVLPASGQPRTDAAPAVPPSPSTTPRIR